MLCKRCRDSIDERHYRFALLRFGFAVLNAFGQLTQPGSPERWAVFAVLERLLGAVYAVIEELEVDPIISVFL
jgi:hypothetical protein